jgi:hypothetical protein
MDGPSGTNRNLGGLGGFSESDMDRALKNSLEKPKGSSPQVESPYDSGSDSESELRKAIALSLKRDNSNSGSSKG